MDLCKEIGSFQCNKLLQEQQIPSEPVALSNDGIKVKKSSVDKKKRQSLSRKRRSSSMRFLFGTDTDFCEHLPLNLPPEKGLHSILQQILQFSVKRSCSEIADPTVALKIQFSVQPQLEAVLDDLQTRGALKNAVIQSKERMASDQVNAECKIQNNDYLDRLKMESSRWDELLQKQREDAQWPNTCTTSVPHDSLSFNNAPTLPFHKEFDKNQKISVTSNAPSQKLASCYNSLHLQMSTITQTAKALQSFSEKGHHDLFETIHRLNTAANSDV